ncbi:peptidase inhibitor family I36 protein [Streptomyces silvisoli]|uniref:Peptidase inhibitor family I36 protein n=1 Tax=Streptomyces silvisoli TaxID=3034235 RepID=A0ABT5ZNM2_9ACTN|nr:peptidase inhibitor family I36 protein [Streptomyces silvisoli]MDF3290603.1 peptidase inhibitor family I36 protein [Streptomyces silvisoli]
MRTIRDVALTASVAALVLAGTSVTSANARPAQGGGSQGACAAGQLCLWPKTGYRGQRQTVELAQIGIERCTSLPEGVTQASLANRLGRPVTTYQSETCAETGEFTTYPSGTWVPESPFVVRAYKVWEN